MRRRIRALRYEQPRTSRQARRARRRVEHSPRAPAAGLGPRSVAPRSAAPPLGHGARGRARPRAAARAPPSRPWSLGAVSRPRLERVALHRRAPAPRARAPSSPTSATSASGAQHDEHRNHEARGSTIVSGMASSTMAVVLSSGFSARLAAAAGRCGLGPTPSRARGSQWRCGASAQGDLMSSIRFLFRRVPVTERAVLAAARAEEVAEELHVMQTQRLDGRAEHGEREVDEMKEQRERSRPPGSRWRPPCGWRRPPASPRRSRAP